MECNSTRRGLFIGAAGLGIAVGGAPALALSRTEAASKRLVSPKQPSARTNCGVVRGYTSGDINIFRGIPYGAPTSGENRFMPPQPPKAWDGVRDTLNFGHQTPAIIPSLTPPEDPPQDTFLLYRGWTPHVSSEDCLKLNVWSPQGSGKRAVMVYMHGGGLAAGSGNDLLAYDGENLARRGDVVVVTHNHRLNVWGFMDLSSFGGRWKDSVNVGMQDIVAVLRWVRDNIAEFGGDPDNVTIFGQSGGGFKVQAMMRMPAAKGLFHKAVIQSGIIAGFGSVPSSDARLFTQSLLPRMGVTPENLDKLSSLPAMEICAAIQSVRLGWNAVHDGRSMIEPMDGSVPPSLARDIPLLIGSNLAELVNAVDSPIAATFDRTALVSALARNFGADAQAIADAYIAEYPGLPMYEVFCAIMASLAREPSFVFADTKFAQARNAWQYMFNWRTPVLGGKLGCFHSAEIAFVFNNADLCENQTGGGDDAIALAHHVSDAWIAFAKTGNPGHAGIPSWPAFDRSHPTMVFDSACVLKRDPEATGRALIRKHGGVTVSMAMPH